MQSTNIPAKFLIPWGNSAGGSFIRTIPQASQIGITNGAASLTDGFPPLNFTAVGSGGIPPFGQDMNGILKQITQWAQWQAAAAPIYYDAAFSASIGGYPKGTLLSATSAVGNFWISTIENNASNPDTGGANWTSLALTGTAQIHYGSDTGSVNSIVSNVTLAILSYLPGNAYIINGISATNTGAMSANFNGIGSRAIVLDDGSSVPPGVVGIGSTLFLIDSGTNLRIANVGQATLPPSALVTFLTSTTWTVPAGVTRVKRARIWGAGGGGGGSSGVAGGGSGAGAGGYAEVVNLSVSGTVTVTIGAGGAGGTNAPTNGSTGGTSSFGAFASATGGGGGTSGSGGPQNTSSGAGGTGSGPGINLTGEGGGFAYPIGGTSPAGGVGGAAPFGGSIPSPNVFAIGQNGNFPGGGASGGSGGSGATGGGGGGAGAAGYITIEY